MAISTGKVVALIQAMGSSADPAVIESAVQDWLDNHPEATTTVQDGSITEQKLASAVAAKLAEVTDLKSAINQIIRHEDDQYANNDYSVGEYFIYDPTDSLFRVKTAISSGDTIVAGANVDNIPYSSVVDVIIDKLNSQVSNVNAELTNIINKGIINIESDGYADNSYTVGELFYYPPNNVVFRVTAPIATGDQFIAGSNILPVNDTASNYLVNLISAIDTTIHSGIETYHDVRLLTYKDIYLYSKARAVNGTKTAYTSNSVSFATTTAGDFNGILFGYNTSVFSPESGGMIANTVVVVFNATVDNTNWKLRVYNASTGLNEYTIKNGFNAIEIPVNYITNMYLFLAQSYAPETITISDFVISQGTIYENPYAYVKEPPKKFKKMLNVGDSLSNISGNGGTGANRWQDVLLKKCGVESFTTAGGVGFTVALYNGQTSIWESVNALTVDNDVDLLTFWGGTNDWSMNIPIGTLEDNVTTQDNTTFYGAVISCVKKLISLYPKKRLFMIGTTPRQTSDVIGDFSTRGAVNGNGNTLMDYNTAVKNVAEYYSLPYIDLMHLAGITDLNYTEYLYSQTYNTGYNYYLHFTDFGEIRIGDTLAGFVNSITGSTWQ